jgi:hypothetical protein
MKPNLTIRLDFSGTKEEIKWLAINSGLLREDPGKKWTDKEIIEHARYKMKKLIEKFLQEEKEKGMLS